MNFVYLVMILFIVFTPGVMVGILYADNRTKLKAKIEEWKKPRG